MSANTDENSPASQHDASQEHQPPPSSPCGTESADDSTEPCQSGSGSEDQSQQQQSSQGVQQQQHPQLEYVADDFVARIRAVTTSAGSHVKSSVSGSSISSWASSSNYGGFQGGGSGVGVSRSTSYPISLAHVTPDDIPEIDPHALADLETHARRLSDQLIHLTASLRAGLHAACGITAQHSRLHKQTVDGACDSVEAAIRHMYALMARCEEVASAMNAVHQLRQDVENVKRVLDRLEAVLC